MSGLGAGLQYKQGNSGPTANSAFLTPSLSHTETKSVFRKTSNDLVSVSGAGSPFKVLRRLKINLRLLLDGTQGLVVRKTSPAS